MKAIVCMDANNGIGKNNIIPWKLSTDMEYFKSVTSKINDKEHLNIVVMGKNTFHSIGKPLPNRINIIISTTLDNNIKDAMVFKSPEKFITFFKPFKGLYGDIFIIGGQQIYKAFENHIEEILITQLKQSFQCDTFFNINIDKFKCTTISKIFEEKGIHFNFKILKLNNNNNFS
jgi:dihydrofolate reductase